MIGSGPLIWVGHVPVIFGGYANSTNMAIPTGRLRVRRGSYTGHKSWLGGEPSTQTVIRATCHGVSSNLESRADAGPDAQE